MQEQINQEQDVQIEVRELTEVDLDSVAGGAPYMRHNNDGKFYTQPDLDQI